MRIEKSKRHSKLTGDFGETMLMYWLSKHGYDVAKVDFTGIDLIAYNRKTKERLGITVRARSRMEGTGKTSVSLPKRKKVFDACKSFACSPYLAIVVDSVDEGNKIRLYLLAWSEIKKLHIKGGEKNWYMKKRYLEKYEKNPKIKKITFNYEIKDWS